MNSISTCSKKRFNFQVLFYPVKKETGIICDQTGVLKREVVFKKYPEKIRRIKYYDSISKNTYVFITNNKLLDATMIAALYKQRWQIELFFKWIKEYLKVQLLNIFYL